MTLKRTFACLALAFSAAVPAGGALLAASPAGATTTTTCKTIAYQEASTNIVGYVTHGVTGVIKWCYAGGKITSISRNRTHDEHYLWQWNNWSYTSTSGGVGSTSSSYTIKGSFKECAAWCFDSGSNTLKLTVNGNGTYSKWGTSDN